MASEIPAAGWLERTFGAAAFQRFFALLLAAAGLAFSLAIAALYLDAWRIGAWTPFAAPDKVMDFAMRLMCLLLLLVAGALALYLALRGHRNILSRLLAVSCAALCSAVSGFHLTHLVLARTPTLLITSPTVQLSVGVVTGVLITLVVVWLFSFLKFVLYFPKPVKMSREASAPRPRWSWPRFASSPQLLALAAGIALIAALDLQGDRLTSATWGDSTVYLFCWLPFAVIGAKQRRLPEEDRRAIRWVVLGQAAWLMVFLLSMLATFTLRASGGLAFASWTESERFLAAFFGFFFCGFVLILIATLAFSILYHGTLDPDLMIRRAWFLGALGLVSGVLFVLVERVLAGVVAGWAGISAANAFTLVAIVTAVVVLPLRTWLERRIRDAIERWQPANALADGARRDAVIVFADLSGYTALTERNEREALIMAAVFHRNAQVSARANHGQLIKTIGDAAMLRFERAEDAHRATTELQRDFRAHIEAMSLVPLPIHAAIHRGEVVEGAGGDVFGATVNLAARLLGVAGPDEIVASVAALDRTSLAASAHPLGERHFKNVAAPVECFRLSPAS